MTNIHITRHITSNSAVSLISAQCFSVFYLIVLVLQPATLLFWFSLTALISINAGLTKGKNNVLKIKQYIKHVREKSFELSP